MVHGKPSHQQSQWREQTATKRIFYLNCNSREKELVILSYHKPRGWSEDIG
jgi:hypothetical protein